MGDLDISKQVKLRIILIYIGFIVICSFIGHTGVIGRENSHYFSQRRNFVNRAFVKNGWLWFSVAFWAAWGSRPHQLPRRASVIPRYAAATVAWIIFSQWFFGAPLMDRIFVLTGGSCVIDGSEPGTSTSRLCRGSGGVWTGGHDPSGHVFLLVLTSIVTWLEFVPKLRSLYAGSTSSGSITAPTLGFVGYGVLGYLTLNALILFTTCVYFHSFLEKTSGLLFALLEVFLVYWLGEDASWGWIFGTETTRTLNVQITQTTPPPTVIQNSTNISVELTNGPA